MNQRQRGILTVSAAVVASMTLFPPFALHLPGGAVFFEGYSFIGTPPQSERAGARVGMVAVGQLLMQLIGFGIVAALLFVLAADRQPSSVEVGTDPVASPMREAFRRSRSWLALLTIFVVYRAVIEEDRYRAILNLIAASGAALLVYAAILQWHYQKVSSEVSGKVGPSLTRRISLSVVLVIAGVLLVGAFVWMQDQARYGASSLQGTAQFGPAAGRLLSDDELFSTRREPIDQAPSTSPQFGQIQDGAAEGPLAPQRDPERPGAAPTTAGPFDDPVASPSTRATGSGNARQ